MRKHSHVIGLILCYSFSIQGRVEVAGGGWGAALVQTRALSRQGVCSCMNIYPTLSYVVLHYRTLSRILVWHFVLSYIIQHYHILSYTIIHIVLYSHVKVAVGSWTMQIMMCESQSRSYNILCCPLSSYTILCEIIFCQI